MSVYSVDTEDSTASRIRRAARDILIAEGPDAVTMRRVAAAAGITPMAIYRHFPDRDAMLTTVADETFLEIAGRWQATLQDGDPESRLFALLTDYLEFALVHPRLYHFVFATPRDDARRFPDDFRAGRSPTLNLVAAVIEDGIDAGIFRRDDVWEVALTLAASMHGLVALYHAGRIALSERDFHELCHAAGRRILDGIKT